MIFGDVQQWCSLSIQIRLHKTLMSLTLSITLGTLGHLIINQAEIWCQKNCLQLFNESNLEIIVLVSFNNMWHKVSILQPGLFSDAPNV